MNLMSLSLGPLRSGSLSDDAETCVSSKMGWNVAPFIADNIAVNLLEFCGARDLESVDQLQRELDLTRVAGGLADFSEAGPIENIGGQTHGDDVEEIEEL